MSNSLPFVSDRFSGYGQPRAFACVLRGTDRPELLVFDHPHEGAQIPKGRIEPGESAKTAAIRELAEESGLAMDPSRFIGHLRERFSHPESGETVNEDWYIWVFDAPPDLPETWTHRDEEQDLEFAYRWVSLDATTSEKVHPYFAAVVEMVRQTSAPSIS